MGKKKILIIVILVLSVLMVGLLFLNKNTGDQKEIINSNKPTDTVANNDERAKKSFSEIDYEEVIVENISKEQFKRQDIVNDYNSVLSSNNTFNYSYMNLDDNNSNYDWIYIIPQAIETDLSVNKITYDGHDKIYVYYNEGAKKIPRLSGQESLYDIKYYKIRADKILEDGEYEVIYFKGSGMAFNETIDYVVEDVNENYKIKNLLSVDGDLYYSSDKNNYWGFWEYKPENEDLEIFNNKENVKENILTTLGIEHIQAINPFYDKHTKMVYYHSDFDVYRINLNGKDRFPITYDYNSNHPDKMYSFDHNPVVSPDGKKIIYTKIYSPILNELWISDIKGEKRLKVQFPKRAFVEDYKFNSIGDKMVVLTRTNGSNISNGDSDLWIYDFKNNDIRKINTYGYEITSFDVYEEKIIFSEKRLKNNERHVSELWSINTDRTDIRQIAQSTGESYIYPKFNENTGELLYVVRENGSDAIWVYNEKKDTKIKKVDNINIFDQPIWHNNSIAYVNQEMRINIINMELNEQK